MADPKRVARALQYQQDKPAWWDAVPVADAPGTVRTPTPQEMSWLDRLNELSAGAGKGIESQLEGYKNMVLHPVDTAKQMYQSGKAVIQDPSLLVKGLQAMGERAMGSPQGFGEVVGENINPRNLLRNLARPSIEELTVYHGTPHRFPATERNPLGEFDASKIGTGEGAQAYGHGIYVAESPDVAINYQPRDPKAEAKLLQLYKQAEQRQNYDAMEVLEAAMLHKTTDELREQYPKQKGLVTRIGKINEKAAGGLYAVDLPDEMIDKMLDWDKPLSEQPAAVQEAFKNYQLQLHKTNVDNIVADFMENGEGYPKQRFQQMLEEAQTYGGYGEHGFSVWDELNEAAPNSQEAIKKLKAKSGGFSPSDLGHQLYSMFGSSPSEASAGLKNLGIPGIRYLDAGSRGAEKGTRNFVIFPGEEQNLKILERK